MVHGDLLEDFFLEINFSQAIVSPMIAVDYPVSISFKKFREIPKKF